MITPVRRSVRSSRLTVRRRGVAVVVALLAAVSGALVVAPAADAVPVDGNWSTTNGPFGTYTNLSNGSATPAAMSYSMPSAGLGVTRSWEFTATAAASGVVKVPYTWQGVHAWFQVTTRLDAIVIPQSTGIPVVTNILAQGPTSCCTAPSNGFIYGGVSSFTVQAGDKYGFRLSGSNGDINNFLRGTLTLSTKPFLDATIGGDNRDWPGATDITGGPAPADDRLIAEPGEARWFKFDVNPGQDVEATLQGLTGVDNLPDDYDVALYGDIGAAFEQLVNGDDLAQLAASSASTGVSDTQVPAYPIETSAIPTQDSPPSGQTFAPRVYAPRVYAPRVYAPRVYAPRVYAPRVYAPRVYAPGSYIPENVDESLSDAFSAAQNQVLLAASTNTDQLDEIVSASTGNSDGQFYLRVQGHDDKAFDPTTPFQVSWIAKAENPDCVGLTSYPADPAYVAPAGATQQAVIVTDTQRLGLGQNSSARTSYLDSLGQLATASGGVVVDVAGSSQVQALWDQVQGHTGCPQAVNMVAEAIKTIVDGWRNTNSKYVVIAGGDDVIPFFRYPDTSGLGPESEFSPPVRPDSTAGASLGEDQVQGQDAYGSDIAVTIGGVTVPLPDLAVGRLVKTPSEIMGTVANYLALNGTLPEPDTSLVTGYDFLADAADAVNAEFKAALPGSGATTDALITHPGTAEVPWTAGALRSALLGSHHDVVYLAGHFSANDTLAADFDTTFDADELDPTFQPDPDGQPGVTNADKLKNTLVLSAGCHSGYSIIDGAAVPNVTNTFDWTQRMAQQQAVLIGGTGYQYGDTDFLEYSERLYLDVTRRLHEDTGSTAPIAIGRALVLAKQDYLSSLTTLSGIDQKAMLEATLYGLPMMGFDAPRRSPLPERTSTVGTSPVLTGTVGAAFGLETADLPVTTSNVPKSKTVVQGGTTYKLQWLNGADGVSIQPGAPAIPKQVKDVTVAGKILRGVGFWSGDYTDDSGALGEGILPLTGAPAIEGSTPNSTFISEMFFPQRLATVNYFGALGDSGRTTLVVNPAQYRTLGDPEAAVPVNTVRNFSQLDMRLFYSPKNLTVPPGQADPTLAAPPGISLVRGTVTNGLITFSARVTGDPAAGVQGAWVTWTGDLGGSGHGKWRSLNLTQDPANSTLWTGTLPVPAGQPTDGMHFLVQAANGVGAVSLDAKDGDGYGVTEGSATETATVALVGGGTPFGVHAVVSDGVGAVAGRNVVFNVLRAGTPLFTYSTTSASDGTADLALPAGQIMPGGRLRIVATIFDSSGQPSGSDSRDVVLPDSITMVVAPTSLSALAGGQLVGSAPVSATLSDARGAVADYPVTFSFPIAGPSATFPVPGGGVSNSVTVLTDASGKATVPPATANGEAGDFALTVSTDGSADKTIAVRTSYTLGAFISPILSNGTATTNSTGTTPIKVSAFGAGNVRVSDEVAQGLVTAGRVQVRWRVKGATNPWLAQTTDLTRYVVAQRFFQADFKASTWNLAKGKTYEVQVRILPSPKPTGTTLLNGTVDLANRSFFLSVTK